MKILVTGGLGYIGSHTAVELSKKYEAVILDSLINSDISVLDGINNIASSKIIFEKLDLCIHDNVKKVFDKHSDIKGIIHFAALKSVNESINNPVDYYSNNILSLVNLLREIKQRKMKINFIFSSSCTVYGKPENLPISENEGIKPPLTPYGNTKQICEQILTDFSNSYKDFNCISLRYFNPIGAHESQEIGELPIRTPQNLVPIITQSVAGVREKLIVHGNDYSTPDGTCIRDYIHVIDLAYAHILAIDYLENNDRIKNDFFNIGTGNGHSVLELIKSFEKSTKKKVEYSIGPRREGDIECIYADNKKALKLLSWKPKYSLEDALLSAWNWEKKIRNI